VTTWRTHEEVLEHLGVDTRTLKARMRDTPTHITKPWVNYGSAKRPRYHWDADAIDLWWREINEWRCQTRPREAGRGPVRPRRRAVGHRGPEKDGLPERIRAMERRSW